MYTVTWHQEKISGIKARTPGAAVYKFFKQLRRKAIDAGLPPQYWPQKPRPTNEGGWKDVEVKYEGN